MADPGAPSASIAQITTTAGLGSYTLGMPIRDKLPISAAYTNGSSIRYQVTDDSGTQEVCDGVFSLGSNTLTRASFVLSSTGNFINWPATGQRIVTPLVTVIQSTSIFIHRVTFGLSDSFLVLPASINVILWSSSAVGGKSQTIPAANAYDSIILHVKMNPLVTGTLTVVPSSGTIEKQSNIAIETPSSIMMIGDGLDGNWVIL